MQRVTPKVGHRHHRLLPLVARRTEVKRERRAASRGRRRNLRRRRVAEDVRLHAFRAPRTRTATAARRTCRRRPAPGRRRGLAKTKRLPRSSRAKTQVGPVPGICAPSRASLTHSTKSFKHENPVVDERCLAFFCGFVYGKWFFLNKAHFLSYFVVCLCLRIV